MTLKIDERNLKFCKYLNLCEASITRFDTIFLWHMRALILRDCKQIRILDTKSLTSLEYLHAGGT